MTPGVLDAKVYERETKTPPGMHNGNRPHRRPKADTLATSVGQLHSGATSICKPDQSGTTSPNSRRSWSIPHVAMPPIATGRIVVRHPSPSMLHGSDSSKKHTGPL